MSEILDIVNLQDEVIGQADRQRVHSEGLTCRLVYVQFYTPDKRLIFQRRSMTKQSSPGKLTTTVSGHVAAGDTYDETAVKESHEESGITLDVARLRLVHVRHAKNVEGTTYINDAMRAGYTYMYDGHIKKLKVEPGEGAGFELMTVKEFMNDRQAHPEQYAPYLLSELGLELVNSI
jgi:isopentenyldiphosphate isomerase